MVFLFSYYLFDFIFNLLFMIACYFTMVIFIFLPFIFISYFKFIFVPFFLIYFLLRHFFSCVLQMRPSCASSACHYFQFYPYWPFENPPRRTPRPSELPGKLKSPCLCCCIVIIGLELDNFILCFSPPSHTYHGHPIPSSAILVAKVS